MYSFYEFTQWSRAVLLAVTLSVALWGFRKTRRTVYIVFMVSAFAYGLAPSTPWIMRGLNHLQLTAEQRSMQDAMNQELQVLSAKYESLPYHEVPYLLHFPFGETLTLLAVVLLVKAEVNGKGRRGVQRRT